MTAKAPLAARCARCSRRVLEVRADHHLGVLIGTPRLDPIALTSDQVLACVLTGIRLWQIQERSGSTSTSLRTRHWPTRPVGGHTAPEHTCTRTWDAPTLDLAPDEVVYPDQPPF